MPRFVFAIFALLVLFGLHYYVWRRLARDTALPPRWRLVAGIAVAFMAVLLITVFIVRRLARGAVMESITGVLYWAAMIWLGFLFFLFVCLVAADLVRLGMWIVGKVRGTPSDPQRRVFLARAVGGAAAAVAATAGLVALRGGLGPVSVREVRVPLRRLSRGMHGTTIVQLTDMHVGPTIGKEFVEDVVRRVNALQPDIVAITGDMVDAGVDQLRDAIAPLAGLKTKHGVFFVTGNHEYYAGAVEWCEHLPTLGIRVLRNERVTIGDGADAFDLAGIDDFNAAGAAPGHGPDLPLALADRDEARELVLLAHQPRAIDEAKQLGVGLQLSGHTHGGQLWPWRYLVYLQQPIVSGLEKRGETYCYTSCGTGYWGPPMRLGAPAEITKVVLESAPT